MKPVCGGLNEPRRPEKPSSSIGTARLTCAGNSRIFAVQAEHHPYGFLKGNRPVAADTLQTLQARLLATVRHAVCINLRSHTLRCEQTVLAEISYIVVPVAAS